MIFMHIVSEKMNNKRKRKIKKRSHFWTYWWGTTWRIVDIYAYMQACVCLKLGKTGVINFCYIFTLFFFILVPGFYYSEVMDFTKKKKHFQNNNRTEQTAFLKAHLYSPCFSESKKLEKNWDTTLAFILLGRIIFIECNAPPRKKKHNPWSTFADALQCPKQWTNWLLNLLYTVLFVAQP